MALIKCSECNNEVSDKAASCPHCGCPVQKIQSEPETDTVSFSEVAQAPARKSKFLIIPVIFIIAIIVLILIFAIFYLGGKKSPKIDDEIQSLGKSAVKVIDDYLDNSADYDTTSRKLDGLSEQIDEVMMQKNISYSPIKYDVSFLNGELFNEYYGKSSYFDLLEKRNELAEELNLSTRDE